MRQDFRHGTAAQFGWFGARNHEWLSKNLTTLRDLVMLAVVSVPAKAVVARVSAAAIVTATFKPSLSLTAKQTGVSAAG